MLNQPGGLLLELPLEHGLHVLQSEGADGRASEAVGVGGEDGVERCVVERRLVHILQ